MAEALTDALQFLAVFVAVQFLALLLCIVFFPVIPVAIAAALVRAFSPACRRSSRANPGINSQGSYEDQDLDLVVVLQGVEDSARHGNR